MIIQFNIYYEIIVNVRWIIGPNSFLLFIVCWKFNFLRYNKCKGFYKIAYKHVFETKYLGNYSTYEIKITRRL